MKRLKRTFTKTFKSRSFPAFAALMLLALVTACGGHSPFENSMEISTNAKLKMFKEPTEVLPATTAQDSGTEPVYDLSEAKFGVDAQVKSVSAQVKIVSKAGIEIVDLVGALRANGTASLVDLHPLTASKNRLVAEALCVDAGVCQKMILNVYYNIGGKTLKKQFSSGALRFQPTGASADGEPVHESEKNITPDASESDVKLGDFVGAPRNEGLIGQLWTRSETPELPQGTDKIDALSGGSQVTGPSETADPVAAPHVDSATANPARAAGAPAATSSVRGQTSAPAKETGSVRRWMTRARDWLETPATTMPTTPKTKDSKSTSMALPPSAAYSAPATSAPIAPTTPRRTPPTASPALHPAQASPATVAPAPVPAPVPPVSNGSPAPQDPVSFPQLKDSAAGSDFPFPPASPTFSEDSLLRKISLLEAHAAPLMNVRDGGVSQGSYSDASGDGVRSAIVNASHLVNSVGLVLVTITPNAHYGSGLLVSFIENAATLMNKQFGLQLFVGDMSLKNGGPYGNGTSHNTHQDGLDVDLAWIGVARPLVDSVLTAKGNVVEDFDYEKTWNFLRLAQKQEIVQDATRSTAISRIFMSPAVKQGFCAWAKEKNLFASASDAELMRLIRPVAGHYKHFHLSLKCSPHYPLCRNLAGPPPEGTGCSGT